MFIINVKICNILTFKHHHLLLSYQLAQDRLTHVQLLFTWNPSPHQSSKFSFDYLLLPPWSAQMTAPPDLTIVASMLIISPSYMQLHPSKIIAVAAGYRWNAPAPSIFRAGWFGRWVVTHSLADFDFHDHRPAVYINQHLLWYLMSVFFGTLTQLSVHPASPVLLTKNGPLATHIRWQDSKLRETVISPI
jgi:hypothetical protein